MSVETTLTPELIARYTSAGYWSDLTIGDRLDRMVAASPDKTAIVDTRQRMTYAEFGDLVNRIAVGLHELGIRKGDSVTAQLPNWIEAVAVLFGASKIGAIICPVVPYYGAAEMQYILDRSESVACIVPDDFGGRNYPEMLQGIRPSLPSLQHLIVLGEHVPEGMIAYRELVGGPTSPSGSAALAARVAALKPDANDPLMLLFTSGTEASPKAVIHTHNTLQSTTVMNSGWGFTSEDVVLCLAPAYHALGLAESCYAMLAGMGGTSVWMGAFDPEAAMQIIEREKVTALIGVPPQVISILSHPNFKKYDLSSLRMVNTAGMTMLPDWIKRLRSELGCRFVTHWGATEALGGPVTRPDDPPELASRTVGRAAGPSVEIVVFDEQRENILPAGQAGEMAIRGPFIHVGYYKDPEKTRDCFHPDGWFMTGDAVVMDEKGYITFVGRQKDMINRGGEKISPREVEEHLSVHPKILASSMVGMPDPRLGERSCIYVIPKPGESITLEEIVSFLLQRGLAKVKLPERLEVVESLPLTPSGKVRKAVLREEIARKVREGR